MRKGNGRWLCPLMTLALGWLGSTLSAAIAPSTSVEVTRFGKRTFHLDRKPTLLFWAYGLEAPEHLREYRSFGFNTLYVDVAWPQSGNVEELRGLLAHRMGLVRAAQREGLHCIIGIEVAPVRIEETEATRVAPDVELYAKGLRQWLDIIVQNFGPFPNVIGYGTQHDPRDRITFDDIGFRDYLKTLWETPSRVAARWEAPLTDWKQVTTGLPAALEKKKTLPLSLASIDLATYQWVATTRMLSAWAAEVKSRDPDRLLFTGRIRDYKTLACVSPQFYDGVVPCAIPGEVERDLVSHNVHAVDIARRGGLLAAVPCLMTTPNRVVREEALQRQGLWLKEALLHGASGACFANWEDLRGNEAARSRIRAAIEADVQSGLVDQAPTPTSAILYEPFADGALVERNGGQDPLYGFLPGFAPDEPMALMFSLRRGSRFGQVDVVGVDALVAARLERYGSVLAPAALHLDPRAQEALAAYVFTGGTVVADLGVGAAQANGQMNVLPDTLRDIFGVIEVSHWLKSEHNLVFVRPHPLFPSVEEWSNTSGNLNEERTVGGLLGVTRLYADTIPFGVAVVEPKFQLRRRQKRQLPTEYSSVSIHAFGRGHGVYAPFRLWSNWMPQHDGYQEFHNDLLARNAVIELSDVPGLFADTMPNHTREDQLGVACAAFAGGYAFFNASDRVKMANATAIGLSNCLLTHCDVTYEGLAPKSPPPLMKMGLAASVLQSEAPVPQLMSLKLVLNPGDLTFCRFLPLRVASSDGVVAAQVGDYSPQRASIKVWSPQAVFINSVTRSNGARPKPMTMRFTIGGGEYRVEPQSKHLVQITNLESNRTEKGYAVADENGLLKLERKGLGFRVEVEHLPEK